VLTSQSIVEWFAPPELSRPDLRQRAHTLWTLSWRFFAVITLLLGIAVLIEPYTAARRATTIGAVGALMAVLHAISRGGRPVVASWMLVTGLSAIVTQRAWVTGGIHSPVAVFYVLFIVMAGVLLGRRGGLATAAVCAVGAIVLTAGTAFAGSAPGTGVGSALGGFVFAMLAIGLALILQASATAGTRRGSLDVDAVHMVVGDMRSPMQIVLSSLEVLRRRLTGEYATDVEAAIGGVRSLCVASPTACSTSAGSRRGACPSGGRSLTCPCWRTRWFPSSALPTHRVTSPSKRAAIRRFTVISSSRGASSRIS